MNQLKSIFVLSQAGCLMPLLILFNLFFGLFFFKPLVWLAIESFLILVFLLTTAIFTRKILSSASYPSRQSDSRKIIDVEAEIDPVDFKPKK